MFNYFGDSCSFMGDGGEAEEVRKGFLETTESNRQPSNIAADGLLSQYDLALQRLRYEATGRQSLMNLGDLQGYFSTSILRDNKLDCHNHDEVNRIFSSMSRNELITFCSQVHSLLFPAPSKYAHATTCESILNSPSNIFQNFNDTKREEKCASTQDTTQEHMQVLSPLSCKLPSTLQSQLAMHSESFLPTNERNKSDNVSPARRLLTSPGFDDTVVVRSDLKKGWVNGRKTLNEYILLKKIGKGTSGKVKLACNPLKNEMVAVKIITRPKEKSNDFSVGKAAVVRRREALEREIKVMKRVQHKNLVRLYEVIDSPKSDKLLLVMQYIDNGPISVVDSRGNCPKMAPMELAAYALQIVAGLECLHHHGVVHRDIKPENILVDCEKNAYLADFGVSVILDETDPLALTRLEGTPLFVAPEVFAGDRLREGRGDDKSGDDCKRKSFHGKLPFSMDVWSLGVTFYTLLVGQVPFLSLGEIQAAQDTPVVIPGTMPEAWRALLSLMLVGNPWKRLTLVEVRTRVERMFQNSVTQPLRNIFTQRMGSGRDNFYDSGKKMKNKNELNSALVRRPLDSARREGDKILKNVPSWCVLPKITSGLSYPMRDSRPDLFSYFS